MSTHETEEQEISSVEQGFRHALITAFLRLYEDTGNQTKWGDAAIIRFGRDLASARAARAAALKVIGDET